ncbi:peptide chain release factor 2 [Geothrix edaphica]|uniref:Peptide chain release factor 2 n=1 Tax=Geothrix edaphica TaxID=2927976 RepID=A0ABQ5Q1Y3_9BACT|nr:peptide chain release factor 2 [Geothrix edaphica]GLH68369.1 peptide chain release factor 2 [Geothrix edaphica]
MDFETLVRAKNELDPRVRQLVAHLDPERKALELEQIEERTTAPGFWDDPEAAKPLLQKRGAITDDIALAKRLTGGLEDLETGLELAKEDGDMLTEAEAVEGALRKAVEDAELRMMLSGDLDHNRAIVAIAPGAGGTESQDWAAMLLRMYLRFCEAKGWGTEMLDYQDGEEGGIKGATFIVDAPFSYGYLRAEAGVHRLVRISPFDSAKRRHTSFAAVYVSPELDDTINVDIPEKDLKIDVFRASGAGGQHVNRTESAVRFTHLPTGIVVSCQNERSQIKNRATALKVLQGRLYELEQRKFLEKVAAASGDKADVAWGSQIRSYVLQPYQMVKDHRTGEETSQTQKVLDGDIDAFIRAQLLAKSLKAEG